MSAPEESCCLVDVVFEDTRWEGAGLEALSARAGAAVMAAFGHDGRGYEICVMGCDDGRISALNASFRGKPVPTNVLSWPAFDLSGLPPAAPPAAGSVQDPVHLGDVALAYETCTREAQTGGKPLEHHLLHLLVHGMLHLLGYDHEEDGEADLMETRETEILAVIGVPDPYNG